MKNKILVAALFMYTAVVLSGCVKTNLDANPTNTLLETNVFSDRALMLSVLANFYISVNYGQQNGDYGSYHLLDEASIMYGPATTTDNERQIPRDFYRVYDYGLVRRMNQFLKGINSSSAKTVLLESDRLDMEAQCRFLRAWYYFCMVRSLGGMPLVGDEIFDYQSESDIPKMQIPRATEAATYRYIINQCEAAATNLSANKTTNGAVANRWAALMLKARAAVYAASTAKYGSSITPSVRTAGGEAGIPADSAANFYRLAFETAERVINQSPYVLQKDASNPGLAFYRATSVKAGNTEVIWAFDRLAPNQVTQFTNFVMPYSQRDYSEGNGLGAVLNLVEAFENKDGSDPAIKTTNADGSYVFYNSVEDPFTVKDARLWGTVIWPNAPYRNVAVSLQAGQLNRSGSSYVIKAGAVGTKDASGELITSVNGPISNSDNYVNKTGFLVRKFLDETANAGLNPRFSEMWMPKFRISEAYLIAAEAGFELGDRITAAVQYINTVRSRGNVQPLTAGTLTFAKIVNEYRVEFAFEDHRFWDLKRWRLAHTLWNGTLNNPTAQIYSLYPYKVVSPGDANNGKWAFIKQISYKRATTPLYFPLTNYYGTIDNSWITNNPKLVINPLQ
ncbi:RagB/SusD family nutrient uptake outer membrane protein [Mucilaginibacter daejeonensis]|uniref:RagB/SusD family nutrient uptake outer membrane protein n=1 Tax=Mucilaginibacter daejeonensis TaxID=398049 RepID=UPI001D17C640|nr:RagB/SusD family nutrient uptake outer membrane protein [Mucilaginibacter daejeonensis]UEG54801.1 RagB/SusD family nutrient uptake outer membrane protein [Mucilaginibacter daejeonensis]